MTTTKARPVDVRVDRSFEDMSYAIKARPGNWLLTTLWIDGVAHHLMAIRVREDGEQRAFDSHLRDELDKVYALYEDTAFQTTAIPGYRGRFVTYAVPHGN